MGRGMGRAFGTRSDVGLYFQEVDQVRQMQRLIGNMREQREHALQLGAGARDRARQEDQRADSDAPLQRLPHQKHVAAVVADAIQTPRIAIPTAGDGASG